MSQVRAKSILQQNRKGLQSFTSSEIFGSYTLAQQQMVKNDIIKIGQSEFANKIYDDIIPNRDQYPRNSSQNNQQKYLSLDHNSDNFFQNNLDLNLSQESLNDIKKIRENLLLSERRIREKKKQQEKQFYSELPRSTLPETFQNEYSIQVRGPGEAYQDNFGQNPDGNLLPVIFDQSKLQPFISQNHEQTIENLDSQHEYLQSDMLKSPDINIEVSRQQSQISLLQLKGKDILKKYQKYNPTEDEYSLYLKLMNKVRKMKAGHKVFNRLKIPVQPPPQEQNVNNSGILTKVQNQQDIQKALNDKRSMNSLEKASKIKAKT
eukprot:403332441